MLAILWGSGIVSLLNEETDMYEYEKKQLAITLIAETLTPIAIEEVIGLLAMIQAEKLKEQEVD